jgi:peptide deformylase
MKFDYFNIPPKTPTVKTLCFEELLNKRVDDVDLQDKKLFQKLEKLGWEMLATCVKKSRLGMAAPQAGVFENMFIAIDFLKPNIWQFDESYSLYINPVMTVLEPGDDFSFPETCLSHKDCNKPVLVRRPRKIMLSYWYYNEKKQLKQSINEVYEGFPARIIQHEYDHTKGLNIVDINTAQNTKLKRGRPAKNK